MALVFEFDKFKEFIVWEQLKGSHLREFLQVAASMVGLSSLTDSLRY